MSREVAVEEREIDVKSLIMEAERKGVEVEGMRGELEREREEVSLEFGAWSLDVGETFELN